jgi:hypothetical protein
MQMASLKGTAHTAPVPKQRPAAPEVASPPRSARVNGQDHTLASLAAVGADSRQPQPAVHEPAVHEHICQRIAQLQEERQNRWQKIMTFLVGK